MLRHCRYHHPFRVPAPLGLEFCALPQSCIAAASRLFPVESKKSKKSRKSSGDATQDEPEPVDVLVDAVIGFLEEATAYMRAVANQVFTLLAGSVQESTIDLILAVSVVRTHP